MRVFTPSAAKQFALAPVDVRRSDPRTGEEVRGFGSAWLVGWWLCRFFPSFFWDGAANGQAVEMHPMVSFDPRPLIACASVSPLSIPAHPSTDPERGRDTRGRDARAV